MKARYPITFLLIGTIIFFLANTPVFAQTDETPKNPEIGITLMGGFYWPWMDWTVDGSIKEEGDPSKIFYQEWRKGPHVQKNVGGIGIIYRKPTYALRFAIQYGKTTKMIYETYKYEDRSGVDTTYDYPEGSRPHVNFSTYFFTLAAMQYIPVYGQKLNCYLGGGFGVMTVKYYDYVSADYGDKSGWGFQLYPLGGLEYRVTPKIGIFTELQYIISSTFKKDFTVIDGTLTYDGDYHLNTDGINIQAGLYYLVNPDTSSFTGRKLSFYTGAGMNMPLNPNLFKDYWKSGFNFSGGIGYMLQTNVELIGRVTYNNFPLDDAKLLMGTSGISIDGMDLQILQFEADVKYILKAGLEEAAFKPFGIIGVGMTNVKVSDVTVKGNDESISYPFSKAYSETNISMSAGFGFDYMFSPRVGMFLDGRLAMIFTSGDSFMYLPVKAGIKVGFGQ